MNSMPGSLANYPVANAGRNALNTMGQLYNNYQTYIDAVAPNLAGSVTGRPAGLNEVLGFYPGAVHATTGVTPNYQTPGPVASRAIAAVRKPFENYKTNVYEPIASQAQEQVKQFGQTFPNFKPVMTTAQFGGANPGGGGQQTFPGGVIAPAPNAPRSPTGSPAVYKNPNPVVRPGEIPRFT